MRVSGGRNYRTFYITQFVKRLATRNLSNGTRRISERPTWGRGSRMDDLMLDLETMGSGIGSVITQIGACYFDRFSGEIGEKFSMNVDMDDCVKQGFRMEPGAVKFWLEQPGRSFLKPPLQGIAFALLEFKNFAKDAECIWSHSTFDFSMIQDAYQKLG